MHSAPLVLAVAVVAMSIVTAGTVTAAESPLRVMSFNVRYANAADGENAWDKRKDLLLDTIREFQPDLLGTQEVLAVQVDFLTEHLRDYTLVGVGRDDGQRRGEFSAVFFKTARFEVVDSGTFWLSETPDRPGSKSWDSSLPRIASWVKLRDRSNNAREICVLNTHWDHRGNQARIESGRLIRGWLAEHARGCPAIVTGDFNAAEDNPAYATLVSDPAANPRLTDAYREVHPQSQPDEATFHAFTGKRRGQRIDFILHSPEFSAVEAAINATNKNGRYPSDHFPVTAVLNPQK